jgi:site-specific recombinase XerD
VNKTLAALRGVLREAWRLGQMSAEDYHRATDLPTVRGETLLRGRALTSAEVHALFLTCAADGTGAGARDAAMIALLYGTGLRRSELVALDCQDYDAANGALVVHAGKGHNHRVVYVASGGTDAMAAWLGIRGDDAGPLFLPIDKRGRAVRRRLSAHALLYVLRRRAKTAGVAAFSPHDLRRTFISDLLDAGADLSTVQRLAGHVNVQTTVRYDRRGEQAKRTASAMLNIPYVR